MTKQIWLIANWKSNLSIQEALAWLDQIGEKIPREENLKVVVCPQFHQLSEMSKIITANNLPVILGSQDLSPFDVGAYTGEDNAQSLKQFIQLSIIGHSERRKNFFESDSLIEKKVAQAVSEGLIPLLCVQGPETPIPQSAQLIAYEPIFAIGTDTPDTPQNAGDVAQSIKLQNNNTEVLYGGSVDEINCQGFVKQDNISGLLIGRASLDAEKFLQIIRQVLEI